MSGESIYWFAGQLLAVFAVFAIGWRLGSRRPVVWKFAATLATICMLGWPLMRLFPAHLIHWFGARLVSYVEVTGIVIPAAGLFSIAIRHSRTSGQGRAVAMLSVVCLLYFVRNGLWMVQPPLVDLGGMQMERDVCLQSTGYTCVAASMVTLLKAHGIDATETQMARLSHTERDNGTTDSRAVAGLQAFLAGKPFEVCYEVMDYDRLRAVPKPCMVPIKWGYFVSHMVPVMSVEEDRIELGDPLVGRTHIPRQKFLNVWHGRGIYLRARAGELSAATQGAS